jgi:transcriptional regulator with XRE-family HTH domain
MESFAELLSQYIKQAGITDTELSRAIGVSRQTIFRWREGLTSRPNSREDVLSIAKKLRLLPQEQDKLLLSAGFRPDEAIAVTAPINQPEPAEPLSISDDVNRSKSLDKEPPEAPEISQPGQKISKTPGQRSRRPLVIAAIIALLIVSIALAAIWNRTDWFSNGQKPENLPAASPAPSTSMTTTITPAAPGETLLLVAPFDESNNGVRAAGQLVNSLQRESKNNRLSNIRIEAWPEIIKDPAQASGLSRDKRAGLIIYGEKFAGQTKLSFSPALAQVQSPVTLSYSDTFAEDIHALSLIILGSLCLDRNDGEQASALLSNARNLLSDNATQNISLLTVVDELLAKAGQTGS